jgi:hypothetical protein
MVRRALALVAALTLLATACAGSDGGAEVLGPATTEAGPDDTRARTSDTTTSTTTRRPDTGRFGAGEDFSVTAALAEIPISYDEEGVVVLTADLVTASIEAGLSRPTDIADESALTSWLLDLNGARSDVFVPMAEHLVFGSLSRIAEIDAELGWSVLDVDAFVEANHLPDRMMVATGEALGPDLMADADVVELADGVYTAGEGQDHQTDLAEATAARRTGAPLRMAVEEGRLAVGPVRADVTGWLSGDGRTLADDDRYRAVAETLDGRQPYAAVVHRTDRPVGASSGGTASYGVVGFGWSVAGDQAVITLVNHFGDPTTAADQVDTVRALLETGSVDGGQPFSSFFTVDSVQTDGPLVVSTLMLAGDTRPMVAFQMAQRAQAPFS